MGLTFIQFQKIGFLSQPVFACRILVIWIVCGGAFAAADDGLPACPIMTDNVAVKEHYADYEGLRYYFCCEHCVNDFQSDPSRFAELDSVTGFPIQHAQSDTDLSTTRKSSALQSLPATAGSWFERLLKRNHLDKSGPQWHLLVTVLLLCIPLFLHIRHRYRKRKALQTGVSQTPQKPSDDLRRYRKRSRRVVRVAWLAIVALAINSTYLSTRAAKHRHKLNQFLAGEMNSADFSEEDLELIQGIHYSTFVDFGFPPQPRFVESEYALKRTYYRGNDERHETMFNGGQYRTVTFHLHLERESGEPIQYGDHLETGEPMYLSITFVRAPDTSNGYYASEYMKRMYLTTQADQFLGRYSPVKDRLQWVETEPGRVWQARFPLPSGSIHPEDQNSKTDPELSADDRRARGIVYLCEDRFLDDVVVGGRYHFAVDYNLNLKDGVVGDQSNLFMGATYRGRNFSKYQITDEQWFSHIPIPEKPE